MNKLNEAVIKLINEDVVNSKKIIEQELYVRLGQMLEEKLMEYAPSIFTEKALSPKQKKIAKLAGNPKKLEGADFADLRNQNESVEDSDELLSEDYSELIEELKQLVEEIEQETGSELTEGEIEELAEILFESKDPGVDPDDEEEEDEDIEEDFDEDEE
jgi:predicted transcriptional regulator